MSTAYSQLLLVLVRDRCAVRVLMRASGVFLLLALAALGFGYFIKNPGLGWSMGAGLLAFTLVIWGGELLKSAVLQNQPAHACLVPQLRRRLITLTLALQAAIGLLVAALGAAVFGHFGYALVGAGLFCCFMLYAQRYAALVFLPSIVIFASLSVPKATLHGLWEAVRWMGEPALTGVGLIAVAVLGVFAVQAAFPRGGDRHWSWHARRKAALRKLLGAAPKPGDATGSRWSMRLRVGYRSSLRRDSRGGATQGGMLLHTFGPDAHEGGYHAYVLLITMVLAVLSVVGDMALLRSMVHTSLLQACVMAAVVMYAGELLKNASRHGAEQTLYVLTPGAPAAAELNRVLGTELLKRFLRVWLVASVCVAGIDMLVLGIPRPDAATFVLCALLLPISCTLLRNYATTPASSNQAAAVVATFLATASYLVVLGAEPLLPAAPLFLAGTVIVLASLLALAWRWRRLLALPAVLPAGRLLA